LISVGAALRLTGAVSHSPEHLSDFGLIDKAVAVGIDAVKTILEERRRLFLGNFAVVIGVGLFQSLAEFFGIEAAETPLAWSAPGGRRAWRQAIAGLTDARATWRTIAGAARAKGFVRRQLSVAVAIEF
jgi:hypothetical protein